ncbi:MAG: formate dehydrogenase accessory protein FdhE [Bacillota bacterium]
MTKLDRANWEEEIKRCTRLYGSFGDAEPFVRAVYSAAEDFFKNNSLDVVPHFDADEAEKMIRAGRCINLNPPMDTTLVTSFLKKMNESLLKVNPQLKDTVKELEQKYEQFLNRFPDEVSKENVIELRDYLIKETGLEKDLATFLFSFLLSSMYRPQLYSISEVLRTDLWERGDCPLCGEKPHFGYLTQESGKKMLVCWLCGTEWLHTRIKCPYCDNEDHEKLGYFTVEDSEICRVNFCQVCYQYYKIFDARRLNADGIKDLSIHNLATVSQDLLARQEGFLPGSGMEWVNDTEVPDRQD